MNQNKEFKKLNIILYVVSDSRNERSDKSGKVLKEKITKSGHNIVDIKIIIDDKSLIKKNLKNCSIDNKIDVVILTGGTGLTGRDSTPEAVKEVLTKEIPGFGEIFRYISYKKIGTSSLQSRAIGGVLKNTFIFSIPGSPSACKDAWDKILKFQLDSRTKPCNLVELIPRLNEK